MIGGSWTDVESSILLCLQMLLLKMNRNIGYISSATAVSRGYLASSHAPSHSKASQQLSMNRKQTIFSTTGQHNIPKTENIVSSLNTMDSTTPSQDTPLLVRNSPINNSTHHPAHKGSFNISTFLSNSSSTPYPTPFHLTPPPTNTPQHGQNAKPDSPNLSAYFLFATS